LIDLGVSWFEVLQGGQSLNRLARLVPGNADFIEALQVQPGFSSRAEIGQAERRVAGDSAASIQDFSDAIGRNLELPRVQPRSFQAHEVLRPNVLRDEVKLSA
jgi:hypothetical protein